MGYMLFIILGIVVIVSILRLTSNQKIRATLIISTILLCSFMITCVATTPDNPRVYVKGYTRANGTKVSAYTRRYPGRKDEGSPYSGYLLFSGFAVIGGTIYLLTRIDQKETEETRKKTFHSTVLPNMEQSDASIYKGMYTVPPISPIGFFDDIVALTRKISARANDFSNDDSVVDLKAFEQVRAIISKYENTKSSYITIHPKYQRKVLHHYIHGYKHNSRVMDIFSSDNTRDYGYMPLKSIKKRASIQIEASQMLILNKQAYDFLTEVLDEQYSSLLTEKAYVWDKDQIYDCYNDYNIIKKDCISPFALHKSYVKTYNSHARFDKFHDTISDFYLNFQPDRLQIIGVESIQESSLSFFQKPYYAKLQKILRSHYVKIGIYQEFVVYGLK